MLKPQTPGMKGERPREREMYTDSFISDKNKTKTRNPPNLYLQLGNRMSRPTRIRVLGCQIG